MKFLQRISAFLAKQTSPFIIAVAVATFFVPSLFNWVRGTTQTVILGIIMLTMGMTLGPGDFKVLAQKPWNIAVGTAAQFILMPGIAWCLVHFLGLPSGIAAGLLLVGCCPGGVSSNIMSFLCKGDVAFSVGMTTVSTLLAPVMTPFLMLHLAGQSINVDAWGMFQSILIVTLLPVALGATANFIAGEKTAYREVCKLMPGISVLGLACIVGGVISGHGAKFFQSGLMIFAAIFLHNGLGYVTGYLVGVGVRLPKPQKRTIAIEVGMQNAGLATVLAAKHFPALPEAAIASAVSCVWHSISGTLLAGLFNKLDDFAERRAARRAAQVAAAPVRAVRR